MSENLTDRSRILEEAFFAQHNQNLLAELRDKYANDAKVDQLASASGIDDPEILNRLVEIGLHAQTIAALSLVPLVEVAWSDGTVDAKEQAAVLEAAREKGISEDSDSYRMLSNWLSSELDPSLLAAWKQYVVTLCEQLTPAGREGLKADLLGRARSIAEATGGILGFGNRVSDSEQKVLDDMEQAFG